MLDLRRDHDPQRRVLQVPQLRDHQRLRVDVHNHVASAFRRTAAEVRLKPVEVRLKPDATYDADSSVGGMSQWNRDAAATDCCCSGHPRAVG